MKAERPATLIGLPDLKVELTGSLEVSVIVNNSSRNTLGYVFHIEDDTGMPTNIPVYRTAGILPGATDTVILGVQAALAANVQAPPQTAHQDGTLAVVPKISLNSVVFADGEFAGPDTIEFYPICGGAYGRH